MDLVRLTRPMDFERQRESSWNETGANRDFVTLQPGQSHSMADLQGPGIIKHLWFTIHSKDDQYLQKLSLRFTWDNEAAPAVDVPFGPFFCCGYDRVNDVETPVIAVRRSRAGNHDNRDPGKGGFNAFFPMPFHRRASLEIINQSDQQAMVFYYVDWEKHTEIPADMMPFRATFNSETTIAAGPKDDDRTTLSPDENYRILDVPAGAGTYIGCNMSVDSHPKKPGKWYEGDDMIWVDGRDWPPRLHGTGTEDYFCHAWGVHRPISSAQFGVSHYERNVSFFDRFYDGRFTIYRLHLSDPVPFKESILVTIEHGHANDAEAGYSSVAYWYGLINT